MRMPSYITKAGALRLQAELTRLRTVERPRIVQEVADAAAQGDRSENAEYIYGKKKLREIDRRIVFLVKRLDEVTVVEPRDDAIDRVYFGALVELEDEDGARARYRIVGADELDAGRTHISYVSPLGKALLGKRVGESFLFQRPSGEVELTVLAVSYDEA